MELLVRVVEIKGRCPAYQVGDTFKVMDYKLVTDIPLCMHALSALMPLYNGLRFSPPGGFGLAGKDDPGKAYIQCLDAADYTGGGTAIFEITRVET